MTEELRDALIRLSARTALPLSQICYIARIVAQTDVDPLPPEKWGDAHDHWPRKSVFPLCDFTTLLHSVPPPYAQVDLLRALLEFHEDKRNSEYAMQRELTVEQLIAIFDNAESWCAFWAIRHPDRESRLGFQIELQSFATLRSKIMSKAASKFAEQVGE